MSLELRYLVLAFDSTYALMAAERELKAKGLATQLAPLPSQIDASCGFCIRLELPDEIAQREFILEAAKAIACDGLWAVRQGASWKEREYSRIVTTGPA